MGAYKPMDKFLDIDVSGCKLYAVLLVVVEGNTVHHQHECYFMFGALRLPFFYFVNIAHNLKFVTIVPF